MDLIEHCHNITSTNLYYACHGHQKMNYKIKNQSIHIFYSPVATRGHVHHKIKNLSIYIFIVPLQRTDTFASLNKG